jgi:hypothetical protein
MTESFDENPYLLLGFWEFSVVSIFMVVFFPWSLLFCLVVYGMDDAKAICGALIHDALKTALAIAALLGTVVTVGLILLASL